MKIKVFVMTHRKFNEHGDKIYIPLHVGRAEGQDLGYLGDDTGDNISVLNKYYGELTGVYWVWKNVNDVDYVGICHYRRFFMNNKRKIMCENEYMDILKSYDIITSNKVQTEEKSYLEDYGKAHNLKDLLIVGEVIKYKYPEYYPYFQEAVNGNVCYYGNLMVTSKKLFDKYAEWLFDVLSEAAMRIDVSCYNLYEQRVYGFLSEQLLKVWIMKNKLKVYEGNVGIVAEKAETVELKLAMKQLVKNGNIAEAKELLNKFLLLRPDVRLKLSDVKEEIPVIEQLIYIAGEEKKRNIKGLCDFSSDLAQWIEHYGKVQQVLINFAKGSAGDEDKQYILDNSVSWVMIKTMLLNPLSEELTDTYRIVKSVKELYKSGGLEEYCSEL